MNAQLLNRSFGFQNAHVLEQAETTRLVHALQPTKASFRTGLIQTSSTNLDRSPNEHGTVAHVSGVNAITVDKFEGRYLLSGGADSSVAIWDLESSLDTKDATLLPLSTISKTSKEHKLGITQLSFYPFDSLAFLSSSYDHTIKIYSSQTLQTSASFNLESVVYAHALSPIASHLLVACATQHPAVRLVDLRSGASTHSLAGHNGAILSVAWSPLREHILTSGSTDGTVRFWDIRRSVGGIGVLDMEDSRGVVRRNKLVMGNRNHGKAHAGAVNGIVWTDDGRHIVTTGHDQRVRVWNADTGANTLANFGPMIRNSHLAPLVPMLAPSKLVPPEKDLLFYPNEQEILMYEMFEGTLLKRMRRPEHERSGNIKQSGGQLNAKGRITALAWRPHDIQFFSAHSDGSIASWSPRTMEMANLDAEEEQGSHDDEGDSDKKRKREELEHLYRDLTKRKITFGSL